MYLLGTIGIDAASSAQSKRVGVGVEHGAAELVGGEARDGVCETTAGGGSDMSTAVKDRGNG